MIDEIDRVLSLIGNETIERKTGNCTKIGENIENISSGVRLMIFSSSKCGEIESITNKNTDGAGKLKNICNFAHRYQINWCSVARVKLNAQRQERTLSHDTQTQVNFESTAVFKIKQSKRETVVLLNTNANCTVNE